VRIGLYGGSFDPIHYGHILPVRAARDELALDRVVYLPTGRPPHKPPRVASAEHRFAMVELALAGEEGFVACGYELDASRPSYTIDTVDRFQREQPEDDFVLVVGADSWVELQSWREWRRLLGSVDLAVLVRPGWEPDGRAIVFSSDRGGSMNLWRMPVDPATGTKAGPLRSVTTSTNWNGRLSIAKTGAIAFTSRSRTWSITRTPVDLRGGWMDWIDLAGVTELPNAPHEDVRQRRASS